MLSFATLSVFFMKLKKNLFYVMFCTGPKDMTFDMTLNGVIPSSDRSVAAPVPGSDSIEMNKKNVLCMIGAEKQSPISSRNAPLLDKSSMMYS